MSCITQLLTATNDWMEMLDTKSLKKAVDVIYLNMQKAFDKVLHKRLLTKLRGYGIHGIPLDWINAFFQIGLCMSILEVSARKR